MLNKQDNLNSDLNQRAFFMKNKISKQLVGRLTLALLICAIIACVTVSNFKKEQITSELVYQSENKMHLIEKVFELMQDYETASRGFVITNEQSFEEPLKNADRHLPSVLFQLKSAIEDDAIQKKHLDALNIFLRRKIDFSNLQIETRKKQGLGAALKLIATGAGKRSMDSIRGRVHAMITHEEAVLEQRKTDNRIAVKVMGFTLLIALVVSLTILLFLAVKVWKNVKERRAVEANLKESNERFNLVLQATVDAIWDCDLTSKSLFWGDNFEILFGHKLKNKKVDSTYRDNLIHSDDKERVVNSIRRVINSNETTWKDEYRFLKADGTYAYIIDSAILIRDELGVARRIIGSMRDVTERKKAEAQLIKSERNLNAILFSSQEALYLLDTDLRLLLMNGESELIMQKLTNKVCKPGEIFTSFFNGDTKTDLLNIYSQVLQGQQVEAERQVKDNGKTLYYYATYFPVKNENGVITNICCSSKNITEKKIIEKVIEAANAEKEEFQKRFQAILDNIPQAIFIKDLEGRFTFTNKLFLETFSLNPDNVIGRNSREIFYKNPDGEKFDKGDNDILNEKKIKEWEEHLTFENSIERDIQFTKFPLYNVKHELFGIGTILKDITEIKKFQQDLIHAREKAENAERLQEQFLANISHELRTPMNGIIGMTNVLLNTPLLTKQKDYLNIIAQSSDTLLNLINDILDLSKIKAGMLKIEEVDFDFSETIAATTMVFKEKTMAKGIRFIVQTEPFIPRLLKGDPYRLIQILNNLLSNSIKFTDKGFVKLEAALVSEEKDEAVVEFIVSDTGIGIEQSSQQTIFNSFEQASNDIARKYGGTGLGLPITKRLVEMQGGQITVSSEPGLGSVFTFTLPYKIPKNNALPVSNSFYKINPNEGKQQYTGKHILIAEDNEINQDVLAATLKQYNLSYTITNNGKETIEQLESGKHFDLIFMDLRMPVMNGYEATAYIREKLHLQIPIVILTASVLRNERERCLSIGASDYMVKPFKQTDLNQCLQKYLQNKLSDSCQEIPLFTTTVTTTTEPSKYNISNLMELEDEESIRHVFKLFRNKIPEQLVELKEVVEKKNRKEFLEKTHKFKGSLSIIQVPEIYKLIGSAEEIANDNGNLQNTLPMFEKAFDIYKELVPEITKDIEQLIL